MNFFGLDLSKVPNQNMSDYTVYIIPVLYVITSFISIKITNGKKKKEKVLQLEEKTTSDKEANTKQSAEDESLEAMQEMSNSMTYMIPIMSISLSFIAPLGLALYWLISNILIIIERLIIDKIYMIKEEKENA